MAVNFAPTVDVHRVNTFRSDSERIACWYGEEDMKRLEEAVRTDITHFRLAGGIRATATVFSEDKEILTSRTKPKPSLRRGVGKKKSVVPVNSVREPESLEGVSWTLRGLEHMASLRDMQQRQARKMALLKCVLVEQDRQRRLQDGVVDESTLAKAAAFCSRESRTRALQKAKGDEAFVKRTLQNHGPRRETSFVWRGVVPSKTGGNFAKKGGDREEDKAVIRVVVKGVVERFRRQLVNRREADAMR